MGIWSNVGSFIGKNAGTIADVGTGLTGMAGAATENRGEANKEQLTRDSIQASAARDYENALQQRAKLLLDQQEAAQRESADAYKQALYSALAKNTQDVSFDRSGFRSDVPNVSFSGGGRPSAIGAEGRAAAEVMNNQAMQRLMNPQKPKDLPEVEKFQTSAPEKAGFWENLAGPAGAAMSMGGSVMDRMKKGASTAGEVAGIGGKVAGLAGGAIPALSSLPVTAGASLAGGLGTAGAVPLGALAGGGGAASGAGGAAGTGAMMGGLGALGTATLIGAPIAIGAIVWKKNRNDTKEAREDFAKEQFGEPDLGQFYAKLEAMGPEGAELARVGRSVIGKKDSDANAQWMQAVKQFVPQGRG